MKVMKICATLSRLSEYHLNAQDYKRAVKFQQQEVELWQWAVQFETLKMADKLRVLAETYQKIGETAEFEKNFSSAKEIYLHCMENSQNESQLLEAKASLEKLELLKK